MKLDVLTKRIILSMNVHKDLVLAIVDEESDITYYKVKLLNIEKITQNIESNKKYLIPPYKIQATLLKERVIIFTNEYSIQLYTQFFYGKQLDELRLQLSFVEALYLIEKNVIEIIDIKSNILTYDEFITQASKIEHNFIEKYEVYKDLRNRSFVPKTGFKFGSHFRVYDSFLSIKDLSHSKYLIHVISENHIFKLPVLSRSIRLSNSVKKKMVFASIFNKSIKYIEIERIKL